MAPEEEKFCESGTSLQQKPGTSADKARFVPIKS